MMKVCNFVKLTIYYGFCLTFVNGKITSHKQRSLPLNRLSAGFSSENYDTSITNPRQSDYVSHSDISDKTVLSNGVTSRIGNKLYVRKNVLNTNANQRNDKNQKIENWPNGILGNAIINNGEQIELKGETSLLPARETLPLNRLRRSDGSSLSVENLTPGDIFGLLTAAVQFKDEISDSAPYKVEAGQTDSLRSETAAGLTFPQNKGHLHRDRRGFRSAVADRIAHGFGKRAPSYGQHGSDHGRLQGLLSQTQTGQAGEIFSLQPDDFDELESFLALYDNIQDKVQTSKNRYDEVTENKETLGEIYRKLLDELQDFQGDTKRSFPDESYDRRRYR